MKGKTGTVKLNLTGSPALRFQGRPLGLTHYTHPRTALAMAHIRLWPIPSRVRKTKAGNRLIFNDFSDTSSVPASFLRQVLTPP